MIWGSNTSLGKTLISTGLASSFLLSPPSTTTANNAARRKFLYLKPVQTGFPSDSDSHFVFSRLSSLASCSDSPFSFLASNFVINSSFPAAKSLLGVGGNFKVDDTQFGIYTLNFREEKRILKGGDVDLELICKTLYAWRDAVSPHLAAERENGVVEDSVVVETVGQCLRNQLAFESKNDKESAFCVIETAGGVASGTLQCDLFRPFRFPGVLVGDGQLGGISGTISAYESLIFQGYDIVAVVIEDHGLANEMPLLSYLRNRVPVILLPPIPQDMSNDLVEWFADADEVFNSIKGIILSTCSERSNKLNEMPKRARDVFWWPFTQHSLVPEENVTLIDSRCGENFAVYKAQNNFITEQLDGCASWWTQGLDATLQGSLGATISCLHVTKMSRVRAVESTPCSKC